MHAGRVLKVSIYSQSQLSFFKALINYCIICNQSLIDAELNFRKIFANNLTVQCTHIYSSVSAYEYSISIEPSKHFLNTDCCQFRIIVWIWGPRKHSGSGLHYSGSIYCLPLELFNYFELCFLLCMIDTLSWCFVLHDIELTSRYLIKEIVTTNNANPNKFWVCNRAVLFFWFQYWSILCSLIKYWTLFFLRVCLYFFLLGK